MGRFDSTKTAIDVNITQNGNQEITGSILNSVLNNMVDATDAQLDILQEAIPTKLSDLEQDIPIGSYDDTELRERIEENEVLIEDLQNTKIDKEADDYYPQLAVGLADNLSGVDVVDSEVNFRRSGGGAISDGVARIEAIKGNSVVWNQLIQRTYKSTTHNGVTYTVNEDGSIVANGTASDFSYCSVLRYSVFASRKYCVIGGADNSSSSTYYFGDGNNLNTTLNSIIIANPLKDATVTFACRVQKGVTVENVKFAPPILIDLTKMFGAGNEPTTIEEFYARIPMGVDLNAYNEGEVIHMDVQSIESQGVNAWGGELERGQITNGEDAPSSIMARSIGYMNIIPNAEYYATCKYYVYVHFYDRNKNFISKTNAVTTFRTPSNAHYLRFSLYLSGGAVELDTQVCINLSDTSINGKYFPYVKRTEDLSIIRKYFPQGMKSAGSAHDEIRYNKTTQKWEYSKGRFRSVDLGTCDWKQDELDATRFRTLATTWKATYTNNLLCEKYATAPTQNYLSMPDKSIAMTNSQAAPLFRVKDSAYTDVASLKASLQGVILYYESNDWEWEELDAEDQFKDLDYQVWNCGTEKAIAEGKSAPLAADITYGFNAIGKIKELESLVAALRAKVGI